MKYASGHLCGRLAVGACSESIRKIPSLDHMASTWSLTDNADCGPVVFSVRKMVSNYPATSNLRIRPQHTSKIADEAAQ